MILGVPAFWASDLNYIWIAIVASMLAFIANKLMTRGQTYRSMLYLDALGVSMFAIQATHKVMEMNFAMPMGPILLGVVTAIGGGLLRDVLSGNPTLLMRKELYAIPVTIGCIAYSFLMAFLPGEPSVLSGLSCMLLIFFLRAAAIYWDLRVPDWLLTKQTET
ncbi:TRIC cation channel family protein [Microbulbifer sp. SAOS-129_SWC]|uniref:trimeric intracellular cation channel family protein n=1 Tax=Microbulbifer sp. SAOS-129_SWC TaxID=3145235 RepID=UPI00321664FB